MAIGIALAAEEHGKIVSARHFCNAVKSYLPTHGTFHKIAHWALCIFADAIRKECAEAKRGYERFVFPVFRALRNFSGETRILRQMFSARIILFLRVYLKTRINPPEAALVFPKSASGGFLLLVCHFP